METFFLVSALFEKERKRKRERERKRKSSSSSSRRRRSRDLLMEDEKAQVVLGFYVYP